MPMTHQAFMLFVKRYQLECEEIMDDRARKYGTEDDRLVQFFDNAKEAGTNPMIELLAMARKHWQMANNLARNAEKDLKLWDECCRDLHNYVLLLAALVRDERVQGTTQPAIVRMMFVRLSEDSRNEES